MATTTVVAAATATVRPQAFGGDGCGLEDRVHERQVRDGELAEDLQLRDLDQPQVGGDLVACLDQDQVARDQLVGRDRALVTVASASGNTFGPHRSSRSSASDERKPSNRCVSIRS
jgi:hypothetical protein